MDDSAGGLVGNIGVVLAAIGVILVIPGVFYERAHAAEYVRTYSELPGFWALVRRDADRDVEPLRVRARNLLGTGLALMGLGVALAVLAGS